MKGKRIEKEIKRIENGEFVSTLETETAPYDGERLFT